MSQSRRKSRVQYLPGVRDWGQPKPATRRGAPRRGHFHLTPGQEETLNLLRGCLLERAEYHFQYGLIGRVLWQRDPSPEEFSEWDAMEKDLKEWERIIRARTPEDRRDRLRAYGIRVWQAILYAFFPELFFDAGDEGREPEPGLIPVGGPRRLGWERVTLLADVYAEIRAQKEAAGEVPVGRAEAGRRLREDITAGPGRKAV